MVEQPPRDIILERLSELREQMTDLRKLMRENLARTASLEGTLTIMHADIKRIAVRVDDHDDRIYALEHDPHPHGQHPIA